MQSWQKSKIFRTASLVDQLLDTKTEGTLNRFFRQLSKTDLLICDEWGLFHLKKKDLNCCSRSFRNVMKKKLDYYYQS